MLQSPAAANRPTQPVLTTIYLALGSNLGDREALLNEAIERLRVEQIETVRRSTIIETAAAYVLDQPHFLNMVIEAQTEHFAFELLNRIQKVETEMGRQKTIDKGPRNIDIDILHFDELTLQTPHLTLPHPLIHERPFVLIPLAELRTGLYPKK
ncbi:MAG: 2-amino-4-hydroxy-6-hydroxymethyldihydropteridine diphosphokinase [Bryobacterales bacterium]|nr:2-amino-4-hydroxy-6-hydroxymethyldihydropteridine diphosphokinase [Bryobacterales bacterium]